MSKIEDALKKAGLYEGQRLKGKSLVSLDEHRTEREEQQDQDNAERAISAVSYQSSTDQIALMDEGELHDKEALSELRMIFSEMEDKGVANRYRDLRTKILQKSKGENVIVMVTSCVDEDDSRTTALNLATAFSFDESKTALFIDCKLHDKNPQPILNIDYEHGLTDYLVNDDVDVDTIIYKSGINRMRVIPAGTAREVSTEFFTSMRMRELMAQLLNRYSDRYIFIDTDPISYAADTRILVDLCDYVALSVPYGKATSKQLMDSVSAIDKDKFLGVIFTDKPKIPKFDFFQIKKQWTKLLRRFNRPENKSFPTTQE